MLIYTEYANSTSLKLLILLSGDTLVRSIKYSSTLEKFKNAVSDKDHIHPFELYYSVKCVVTREIMLYGRTCLVGFSLKNYSSKQDTQFSEIYYYI